MKKVLLLLACVAVMFAAEVEVGKNEQIIVGAEKKLQGCGTEKQKKPLPLSSIFLEKVRKEVIGLTANELNSMIEKKEVFYLIDIRDSKQFERGQIDYDNLYNIDRGHLEYEIEKVVKNKDDKIVLYCCTGRRSALSVKTLKDMGYTNVSHLDKGLSDWVDQRFPLLTQYGVMKLEEKE
jgi:rhodanese-related sulfurtransferase